MGPAAADARGTARWPAMPTEAPHSAAAQTLIVLALTAAAALAVLAPSFFLGNSSGHDFAFHVATWMEVARQWKAGVWYPRWAEWANHGFGEPRLIFYPPISWMLGGALGLVLPWRMVPGAMIWLTLLLAGANMQRLARKWLPAGTAVVAALLFAVNPYHLLVVYYRSDFSELIASALFPLLLLEAIRLLFHREEQSGADWRGIAQLAGVYAAIWLANAPAGVLASYTLALLVAVGALKQRSWRGVPAAAAAIGLGLLLAAFYLVPAAYEQRWVQINQVLSSGVRPEQNFLFTVIGDPEHNLFNLKVSALAAAEIVIAAAGSLFFARRHECVEEAWSVLAPLGLVSVALMLPASNPAWQHLFKLRYVQFPWRWLVPLGVPYAVFVAAALTQARRRWLAAVLATLLLCGLAAAMVSDAWWDVEDVPALQTAMRQGEGYEGADEYAPLGCDEYDLPARAPMVAVLSGAPRGTPEAAQTRLRVFRWAPEEKILEVDSPQPLTVALRLVSYPAWQAWENERATILWPREGTGQVLLPVPAGRTHIELRFSRTADRSIGAAGSCFGLLAWGAMLVIRRRPRTD